MSIAVVIVNFRTPELALSCLRSVAGERADLPELRAVMVDNGSGDHSVEVFRAALEGPEFAGWVELIELPLNGGFGWANNQAMLRLLQGQDPPEFIHLLNPDTVVHQGAISSLVAAMKSRPDAGAVGSQLVNPDGTFAGSTFRFPSIGREWVRGHGLSRLGRICGIKGIVACSGNNQAVDWVTGASLLLRGEALKRVGLFDTGFFLYFEEVELLHRLQRAGWKSLGCSQSQVTHLEGASTRIQNGRHRDSMAIPDYIFHSRRRYFSLTSGRIRGILAALAWLWGSYIRSFLSEIGAVKNGASISSERHSLFRNGLVPNKRDLMPAVTQWNDIPGGPPAWMA